MAGLAAVLALMVVVAARPAGAADRLPNTLSVNAGGAVMVNTKNGLHPAASDVGVAWSRPGEWGGFQAELNYVAFFTAYETDSLLGVRGAWTLRLPRRTTYPFANIGAGIYTSAAVSVLPIGQLALGVARALPNRMSVSLAVAGWVSLFAVGVNPRLAVGYAF